MSLCPTSSRSQDDDWSLASFSPLAQVCLISLSLPDLHTDRLFMSSRGKMRSVKMITLVNIDCEQFLVIKQQRGITRKPASPGEKTGPGRNFDQSTDRNCREQIVSNSVATNSNFHPNTNINIICYYRFGQI